MGGQKRPPGEKVLKERRPPRERGRMGTGVILERAFKCEHSASLALSFSFAPASLFSSSSHSSRLRLSAALYLARISASSRCTTVRSSRSLESWSWTLPAAPSSTDMRCASRFTSSSSLSAASRVFARSWS